MRQQLTSLVDNRLVTATASRQALATPVGVLGVGAYVPPTTVTNDDLAATLDTSDEWIRGHTGIRERRFLAPEQSTSDMCVIAAGKALAAAGVDAADLDAILVGTITPDQPLPSTALMVKEALGAHRAMPLDLNQLACATGVYGILLGSQILQADGLRHVLVIGADAMSRLSDPTDRGTRVFFGDAAGATVLGRTLPGHGLLSWDVQSSLSHDVEVPAGGARRPTDENTVRARDHFLKMDGRAVWKVATESLPASIARTIRSADVSAADVQHFVLHQANLNLITEVLNRLEVPLERAMITVDELGNTGSASIFTAFDKLSAGGAARSGDLIVVAGIGAGFMWGSLCLRHA